MNGLEVGHPLSPEEFRTQLRWALAQATVLLHSGDPSEERLEEVRERVSHLGDKARYVSLLDREQRTRVAGELEEAVAALGSVRDLRQSSARQRIEAAESRLDAVLAALERGDGERSSS